MKSWDGVYYVVQAYLAVSPGNPKWAAVSKTAVTGWQSLEGRPRRMVRYQFGQFWTDVIAWDHEAEARHQFAELMHLPQKYPLRVVMVKTHYSEHEIALIAQGARSMIREPSKIKTYLQDRPADWLKDNPHERWRCDIFPEDGSDHHGVGATEAEALINASMAYMQWAVKHTPPPSSEVQLHTHLFGDTRPHQSEVDHRVDFQYHRIGRD